MEMTRRNLFAGAAAVGAVLTVSKSIISPVKAAAPVAGKQNAGWYRYKVGDFEVTVVTDGMNTNPLSDAYVANAPKPDVNAALADFGPGKVSTPIRRFSIIRAKTSWPSTPGFPRHVRAKQGAVGCITPNFTGQWRTNAVDARSRFTLMVITSTVGVARKQTSVSKRRDYGPGNGVGVLGR
jgi:hypothetical protein